MTKEEIAKVLAELDADLKKGEQEAAETLKKAAEGEPPEKEDASASAGGEDSGAPASDASAGGPPAPDASAGGPPPGPDASAGGAPAPGGDPAMDAGPGLTPEALQAEYAQLPPEELDMHIQAALAAKEALSAAAGPAAGAPGMAPPAPAAPMAPPDASAGGPPMMGKEELRINKEANGGKISMGKSEDTELRKEFESLKKAHEELLKNAKEDTENLTKAVKLVLEAPVRKSISGISEVPADLKKSEEVKPMTRKEVDGFIKENAHKMTKSERDLWLAFVDNKVPASKLAPMLDRLTSTK